MFSPQDKSGTKVSFLLEKMVMWLIAPIQNTSKPSKFSIFEIQDFQKNDHFFLEKNEDFVTEFCHRIWFLRCSNCYQIFTLSVLRTVAKFEENVMFKIEQKSHTKHHQNHQKIQFLKLLHT